MFNFIKKNPQPINQEYVAKFIKQYAKTDNWHNLDPATGSLGYGWIHYSLIRNLKPKRVLCIGSRYGFIPAICALACKDNQGGVVDFVDAGYDQNIGEQNHWGGVGLWRKINKNDYFKPFGLSPFINLHVMTSIKYAKKYPKRKYDYIHLDGDHSYLGVKTDYNLFYPQLTKGGFIALHDICTKRLGGLDYGVGKFWQELKMKHSHTSEFGDLCGLGIVQK